MEGIEIGSVGISDFAGWWEYHAGKRPDRLAFADGHRQFTWEEAGQTARCLSHALLNLGLAQDELVASWLPNWVESYLLHVACERAGLAWMPIPSSLREHEVRPILERAGARTVFVAGKWRRMNYAEAICEMRSSLPQLRHVVGVRLRESGNLISWEELVSAEEKHWPEVKSPGPLILPTSGTTGRPKFAYFSTSSWLLRGQLQAELFRLKTEDVLLAMAPGIGPSIPPLFAAPVAGSTVVLLDRLEAEEILALLEREKVTIVCAVPAQIAAIVYRRDWEPRRCQSVRLWYTTGAPMPLALAEKVEKETGALFLSGYGGMDFGGWTVPSLDDPPEIRQRTVGRPRGGTEIQLVDDEGREVAPGEVGEIWGRGPCCALGYYQDEESRREKWTEDGWFRTGDLGRWDGQGNLVIVGRKKEIIRRGAQTVVPAEIEQVLLAHPKVLEAAVIGLPDPLMGERVCACVLSQPGESLSFDQMIDFFKQRKMAPYKWPELLEVIHEMPRRGGKIDLEALRSEVLRRMGNADKRGRGEKTLTQIHRSKGNQVG